MVSIDKQSSQCIYNMKAMAVISVIFAHCSYSGKSDFLKVMYMNIGSIGVPVFFLLSGLLYNLEKYTVKEFVLNKMRYLIIPWIICGIAVYFYVTVRKGGIGLISLGNFLIGNGSYLYYMTMLIMCMVICYVLHNNKACVVFMLVSFANYIFGYIVKSDNINQYLNPLNWIGYFSAGLYIRRYGNINKIFSVLSKNTGILMMYCILILCIMSCLNIKLLYWDVWHILYSIAAFMTIAAVSMRISSVCVKEIGMYSFTIYLIHMPFVGITNYICNILSKYSAATELMGILRPAAVLIMTYGFIKLFIAITNKIGLNQMRILIGLR